VNHTTSASYPAVRPDDFERATLIVPSRRLLGAFHDKTEPAFRLIATLEKQAEPQSIACGLLLPRLMNGEISV
jgi:type I restriction enzyme S subunit